MADQFCRIVDVNLCTDGLGSNATQAILSTDANCSFVVRDMYQTSTSDLDAFKMDLTLKMDGQDIHSNLTSSASGSLIIPPSSTVCVTDVSGNYPITFRDTVEYHVPCSDSSSRKYYLTSGCTANNVVSGSESTVCNCMYSAFCNCMMCTGTVKNEASFIPSRCIAIHVMHNGNNSSCSFGYCVNGATCCTTFWSCGSGYDVQSVNSGMLGIQSQNIVYIRDYLCCGTNPTLCYACTYNPCSPTTYSEFGLSSPHRCLGHRCRTFLHYPGAGCAVKMTFVHFDRDNLSNCSCAQLLWCKSPSQFVGSCVCNGVYGNDVNFYAYYSEKCDDWMAIIRDGFNCWWAFIDSGGNLVATHCSQNDNLRTSAGGVLVKGDFTYIHRNDACKILEYKTDDILANGTDATCTCVAPGIRTTLCSCWCSSTPVFYDREATANTTKPSCCYDLNPCTKLNLYGIKST
jgi:hypothetical protein